MIDLVKIEKNETDKKISVDNWTKRNEFKYG